MDARRIDRFKDYALRVAKAHGGVEAVLAKLHLLEDAGSPLEALIDGQDAADATVRLADAVEGFQNLDLDRELLQKQYLSLEAIIDEVLRPAFDVVDGKFAADHPIWTHLSTDADIRTRIESVMPSIGRIELPGSRRLPYAGTGFVVGNGVVMTNRHVAEVFARGLGDRQLQFLPDATAGINFCREHGRQGGMTLNVDRVLMIHPYWDMALLAVQGLPLDATPLKLALTDVRDTQGGSIFVVGYPAFDPRNPANIQNNLFNGRYGVKKLQPGELQGHADAPSFGRIVRAVGHDCSTLGGNSGSAVIDLATGHVLALHFGGRYHEVNYGVPAAALSQDSRVVDAGVLFTGAPIGGAGDWAAAWRAADAESFHDNGTAAPSQPSATTELVPNLVQSSNGAMPLQVPLDIKVTLGRPASVALDSNEVMREPIRDGDYSSRTGYDPQFLGPNDPACEVSLPESADLGVVALSLDGGDLLHYQNFSIAMHAKRRVALFTGANVTRQAHLRKPEPERIYTRNGLSGLGKSDQERWFLDPRIDARYQLPDVFFTKDRKAFDKGHLVRREDVAWGNSFAVVQRANGDTYHATNCTPQMASFNQASRGHDNWGRLENHVLSSAASEELCVLAGPVLSDEDEVFAGIDEGGRKLQVKIPSRYWKIIVARVEEGIAAFGFVLEQDLEGVRWTAEEFVVPKNFEPALYRIKEIEDMTGLSFSATLHAADQHDRVRGLELVLRGSVRHRGA